MPEEKQGLRRIRSYVIRTPRASKSHDALIQSAHSEGIYYSLHNYGDREVANLLEYLQSVIFPHPAPWTYAHETPVFSVSAEDNKPLQENKSAYPLFWIDIGFGNGDSLIKFAQQFPHILFLGIEVHELGVRQALSKASRYELDNVLVVRGDVLDLLEAFAGHIRVHAVTALFPDPWPKKRHQKRRLFTEASLSLVAKIMHPGAMFGFASDWQPYSEEVGAFLSSSESFEVLFSPYAPRPFWRAQTKYEKKSIADGRLTRDILATRTDVL